MSKKKTKKAVSRKDFDFKSHNKKVASSRGEAWRKKLALGKLNALEKPSLLRRTRAAKGMSQQEIVKRTSVRSAAAFARIEKGSQGVSPVIAQEIAKQLKVAVSAIFSQSSPGIMIAKS